MQRTYSYLREFSSSDAKWSSTIECAASAGPGTCPAGYVAMPACGGTPYHPTSSTIHWLHSSNGSCLRPLSNPKNGYQLDWPLSKAEKKDLTIRTSLTRTFDQALKPRPAPRRASKVHMAMEMPISARPFGLSLSHFQGSTAGFCRGHPFFYFLACNFLFPNSEMYMRVYLPTCFS